MHMRRTLFAALIAALFSTQHTYAEETFRLRFSEGLGPVQVNGKWGYINKEGNVVIKPAFDKAGCFSGGLAPVKIGGEKDPKSGFLRGGKWGYIDTTGTAIIKPRFEEAHAFSNGLAAASVTNPEGFHDNFGYIDKNGSFVIKPRFRVARRFTEGVAIVYDFDSDGKCFFIDKNGKKLTRQRFRYAWSFSEGLAAVHVDVEGPDNKVAHSKWGFLDKKGKMAIKPRYEDARGFSDGRALVSLRGEALMRYYKALVPAKRPGKRDVGYGYVDKTGTVVIELRFTFAEPFSEGLAVAWEKGQLCVIDKNGTVVFRSKDTYVHQFSEGLALTQFKQKGNVLGYIDKTGKLVTPLFDNMELDSFREGAAGFLLFNDKTGGYGYIDKAGKYIWKPTK